MKNNKKGMTLVECIIAMAVFAVATTGFTMAATTCIKAQIKSHTRNRIANTQTTNLEHFSNYSKVIDPTLLNVEEMHENYAISFNFDQVGINVVNKDVYGYTAVTDPDDKVYQLSYLSPIEQVTVMPGEWWLTIYNGDSSDHSFKFKALSGFEFFDNEKEPQGDDTDYRIYPANGGIRKLGVKCDPTAVGVDSNVIEVTDMNDPSNPKIYGLSEFILDHNTENNAGYCSLYYDGALEEFIPKAEFEERHPSES